MPEEEPPWPEAPPKTALTTTAIRAWPATIATTSQQPSSTAALDRTGEESSPTFWIWGVLIYHLSLLSKGARNSHILIRSPANLNHALKQSIPQCKLHVSVLLISGTYKILTTDRGLHICWWHIPQTNNFVRNFEFIIYL